MSAGNMRFRISIISAETVTDCEGFGKKVDIVLATVRAYHEEQRGTEKWTNMAAFSQATDLFRFRAIPDVEVSTRHYILCGGTRYNVTSVDTVCGRGMYVEVIAKKVEADNG